MGEDGHGLSHTSRQSIARSARSGRETFAILSPSPYHLLPCSYSVLSDEARLFSPLPSHSCVHHARRRARTATRRRRASRSPRIAGSTSSSSSRDGEQPSCPLSLSLFLILSLTGSFLRYRTVAVSSLASRFSSGPPCRRALTRGCARNAPKWRAARLRHA